MAPKDPRSLPLLNTIVTELSVGVEEAGTRSPTSASSAAASSRTWEKCFLRT